MKTLDAIKQEYARENNFCEWSDILYSIDDPAEIDEHFDKVARLFAFAVAKETQRRCAEKALMVDSVVKVYTRHWKGLKIYEQSILSESNIPLDVIKEQ